jgi:cystathionine beta-lyase family protein involved in aluminum resistance
MDTKVYLKEKYSIAPHVIERVTQAEQALQDYFQTIDEISAYNQYKVLAAFQKNRVAAHHFYPSTGYGYGDTGRDVLDRVFADALETEDALVRPQIISGTHALGLMLFGLLQPGQTLLSPCGRLYDTMADIIGLHGNAPGSLKDWGVGYEQIELLENGKVNLPRLLNLLDQRADVGMVLLQRSRGYAWREALSHAEIDAVYAAVKKCHPQVIVALDNCYGEFTQKREPTVDIMAGSLIKNPGGGLAPTGGYLAGKTSLISRVADRLTVPGIGREAGSYDGGYRLFYQGLYLAPHVVGESLKGAALAAKVFYDLGYEVMPGKKIPAMTLFRR